MLSSLYFAFFEPFDPASIRFRLFEADFCFWETFQMYFSV
jgi:hypothetical protein